MEGGEILRRRPPAAPDRAEDGTAKRLACEGLGLGQVEDAIVGLVGGFGDLLAYDSLLLFKVRLGQGRTSIASGRPPCRHRTWKLGRS